MSDERKEDVVNHPKHYADFCSLECIEVMEIAFGVEAVIHFCKSNAFKYLWRYKNKNGMQDLEKAMWYCEYGLQKTREYYQDSEYIDEQLDVMAKRIYVFMESQNVKQNLKGEKE